MDLFPSYYISIENKYSRIFDSWLDKKFRFILFNRYYVGFKYWKLYDTV